MREYFVSNALWLIYNCNQASPGLLAGSHSVANQYA